MSSRLQKKYLKEALRQFPEGPSTLRSSWRCPSNIAIVKYWGKKPVQIPASPSLSFTLRESYTETAVTLSRGEDRDPAVDYLFEGRRHETFENRIRGYLAEITPYFPFLLNASISIDSRNTFPHSSGIASSASGMGALALGICSIEQQILGRDRDEEFYRKASYMARLGSGSAARSVYGGWVSWGRMEDVPGSSDEYASPMPGKAGKTFSALCDAIMIISPDKKPVSSSRGHALMNDHPYAEARFRQARANIEELKRAITGNDIDAFVRVAENEALALHGLMMSSDPGFMLLKPATLHVISRIQQFRQEKGIFAAYTMDAGPNVHLIYPESRREEVIPFIRDELLPWCHNGQWIDDRMGTGPEEKSFQPG